MHKSNEMTSGAPLPLIIKFTLPLLLGNILQQTYSFVDAAIVGKVLGINALASVGASTSVIFLILGFCNGCCAGFGIPIAQSFGARSYTLMRRYVYVSMKLSAIMSLVITLLTSLLCFSILKWMSTPDNIMPDAYLYLLVTFLGIPCTFFYNLLSSIIRAIGDSKTPFWFLMLATILNIILDITFLLLFHWGVVGAAIATVVSQGISAILCYIYMFKKFEILKTESDDSNFRIGLAKDLINIGVPMGLQFSITAIGSIMLQGSNNALGTSCVAAFTAAMRIKMFFLCMLESLGMAMATYTGQNYGAGKPERILSGVKSASYLMILYILVVNFILWNFSENIALLFIEPTETEVLADTSLFLHISASFFIFLGLLCILRYTIQGAGYTRLSMFSGVAEMIARIFVSVVAVPAWGYTAVCFGDPLAWIFAVIFLVAAFRHVYTKLLSKSRMINCVQHI